MPRLIVRAHSSEPDGMGHLIRSIAVAEAWSAIGDDYEVIFVLSSGCEIPAGVERADWTWLCSPEIPGVAWDLQFLLDKPCWDDAVLLIDGYVFDMEYVQEMMGVCPVVLVDERCLDWAALGPRLHWIDPDVADDDRLPYAALRRQFYLWHDWKRAIPEWADHVLLALGGTDCGKLTLPCVTEIAKRNPSCTTHVVYGGDDSVLMGSLQSICWESNALEYHGRVQNMAELMSHMDLAVTAGGSMLTELAYMGLPGVTVVVAENQEELVAKLDGKTVMAVQGSQVEIIDKMLELVYSQEDRRMLSAGGRRAVDGFGALRIAMICDEMRKGVDDA